MHKKFLYNLLLCFLLIFNCSKVNAVNESQINNDEFKRFFDVVKTIKQNYVDKINDEQIVNYAINGVLNSLDKYNSYFDNKKEYENFSHNIQDHYQGIGINTVLNNGKLLVSEIKDASVANRAGILKGDVITNINHQDALLAEPGVLKCEINENILLTILRNDDGAIKNLNFVLPCESIKIKNINFEIMSRNIGVLKIGHFALNTADNIKDILEQNSSNIKGLIIDLRRNGGGILEEAIKSVSIFLQPGSDIASTEDSRNGKFIKYQALKNHFMPNLNALKLIVLTDEGTASASEVFCGAIKDNKRGLIVGRKTYGKGASQNIFQLSDGRVLKLTTSFVYTPLKHKIQDNGIEPDIDIYNNIDNAPLAKAPVTMLIGGDSNPLDFAMYTGLQIMQSLIL